MKYFKFLWILLFPFISSCSKDLSPEDEPSAEGKIFVGSVDALSKMDFAGIEDLTVTGEICGSDWNVLFEISQAGSLRRLNMEDAVVGHADGWEENEIPAFNFEGSKSLEEVILPKSLKSIGEEAFAECLRLKTVKFGNLIDSIAARAFYKTSIHGVLDLPVSLNVIGRQAFAATDVEKVLIHADIKAPKYPTNYTPYGNSVFAKCSKLEEVVVGEGCTKLEVGFSNCDNLRKVTLPSTLKYLGSDSSKSGNYIFNQCSRLEEINLPSGLVFIGRQCFAKTSLKRIVIPDLVESIGIYAFCGCESLEDVDLSSNIEEIGQSCFEGCHLLKKMVFPESVRAVGRDAFADCRSLSEVYFSGSILKIENNAFKNCTSLISVELPVNLDRLGNSAFEGCTALMRLALNDGLESLETSTFKNCTSLNDVYLGKSLSQIGKECFYNCSGLSSLEIPRNVRSFSDYTFAYSGIQELKVHWDSPISVKESVFTGLNLSRMRLEVPRGTQQSYLQADVWGRFGEIYERTDM